MGALLLLVCDTPKFRFDLAKKVLLLALYLVY